MGQAYFDFDRVDLCRNRHRGNRQSRQAHESVRPHKASLRQLVLDKIRQAGANGATLEEIAEALGRPMHSISGRVSELKALGRIRESGAERLTIRGCAAAVLVLVD